MKTLSKFYITLICSFFVLCCTSVYAQQATWISSTSEHRWVKNKPVKLKEDAPAQPYNLVVHPEESRQAIEGWGASFNELGWDALQALNKSQRDSVLKKVFDSNQGLGYNLCRMSIGANDYSKGWYSLDETPKDFKLQHFSLERDKKNLIPYIKAAMKYQPDLKIWGSPWSPPAWMKKNNSYACDLGDKNKLKQRFSGKTQIIEKPKYLKAYANYLAKYVRAYKKEGIDVTAVAIQNEPYACSVYPSSVWSAQSMQNFIANYAGPVFQEKGIQAKLWFGTLNINRPSYFNTVLSDPKARQYIDAIGVQWAGKDVLPMLNDKYAKIKTIQTETECGSGTFDWRAAEHTFSLMDYYLTHGVSAYMYWNMILDDTGKSHWGWKQNAQITINRQTQKVTYTPEYYLFKHFTRFVPKGSVRLGSHGNVGHALAFRNPKGQIVIVTSNMRSYARPLRLKVGDKSMVVWMKPRSFNTFVI